MLEICNIQKRFANQIVLSDINLQIAPGEFFSLLGPSGCGKSTLLRILAGLETADAGEIRWNGKRINDLPARERPFNMVFQRYALFPHLTVAENVGFGLTLKNVPRPEVGSRVRESLALVNLTGFENRLPETLSGGQGQRVALARAIINRPACILLDEPLSALDQNLREHMQTELRLLQKRLGLAFIFVTHDQEEAMTLSDRIAVMNEGVLESVGTPKELYERPRTLFCARFVGRMNELSASVVGRAGRGFIQPERLRILSASSLNTVTTDILLRGVLAQVAFRGTHHEVTVRLPDQSDIRIRAEMSMPLPNIGEPITASFAPQHFHVFENHS